MSAFCPVRVTLASASAFVLAITSASNFFCAILTDFSATIASCSAFLVLARPSASITAEGLAKAP